jgi:DNA-binding PadR family transcriptional regulator
MQMPLMVSISGESVLIGKELELVDLSKRVEIDSHGFWEVNPA